MDEQERVKDRKGRGSERESITLGETELSVFSLLTPRHEGQNHFPLAVLTQTGISVHALGTALCMHK